MTENDQTNYVLGTDPAEIERLQLQHNIWRKNTHETWAKAGITIGSRVIDVGAGPGFCTMDLSTVVGANGQVAALERSKNFLKNIHDSIEGNPLKNISVHDIDLVRDDLPLIDFDVSWCRWVCSFLTNPEILIAKLRTSLRTGGKAIFYEYVDYASWRMLPPEPMVYEFVNRIMTSWRSNGGEPDIAPRIIGALQNQNFEIISVVPIVYCVKPCDPFWTWIAAYMRVNTHVALQTGEITPAWAETFLEIIDKAEREENKYMTTPMLLEIIAEKKS
jgi:SAM-dependent methyltransferase